ncbi:MAG: HD domain-containing protein, partial [Candidatus Caldarchaeum sp.]|nr:HD domain-containing protein [Candidatus Caldarchaeum sp.]
KNPKQLLRTVEKAVFNQLIAGLPPKMARQYAQLYENYIEYKSKEARLVHLLDRRELVYEAMWQALHGRLRLSKFGIRMRGFIRRRPRVK